MGNFQRKKKEEGKEAGLTKGRGLFIQERFGGQGLCVGRIGKEMSYVMEVQLAWMHYLMLLRTLVCLGWSNQPFDVLPSHDFQCDVLPR